MSYQMQNRTKVSMSPNVPQSFLWDKATGAGISHASSRMRPSAEKEKVIMSGETTRENITTEGFVDPERDADFIKALMGGAVYPGTTITFSELDASNIPIAGSTREFKGCQIEKVTFPDADANSEDPQKLVIEWAIP